MQNGVKENTPVRLSGEPRDLDRTSINHFFVRLIDIIGFGLLNECFLTSIIFHCHLNQFNLVIMKRRSFVQMPLIATVLFATGQKMFAMDRSGKGFKVSAGQDRFQKELDIMGGQFNCVVSSKDTEGDLLIYNTFRQEKGGPAYHMHYEQDEWFFVIKGEFMVKVGDEQFSLTTGDSAFAPRKVAHAFAKVNEGEGQLLVLFQPAGTMEDFFEKMSAYGTGIPDQQAIRQLYETHGMQVLGPPLPV
jgi:mannose-6-phosphate isomerase-like protein (cupin superfamily)